MFPIINLEIKLKVSYQAIFVHDQKIKTKIQLSSEQKELLR